jgi:pimeloyl-ACP methyl ester carboxylesterase
MQRLRATGCDVELEGKRGQAQTPTLVGFGTVDKVAPPAMGRPYRKRMPNCHYVVIYDAGRAVAVWIAQSRTIQIKPVADSTVACRCGASLSR